MPDDPIPTFTISTMLVHGWRKTDPKEQFYVVIEAVDFDGDDDGKVWDTVASADPTVYWNHAAKIDDAASAGELIGRVLTVAEFRQAAHHNLALFRAWRRLTEVEAKAMRSESNYDHEDHIEWHKTIERIFFAAAAHDVLISYAACTEGPFSHVESLLEVARLAAARARQKHWSLDDLMDDPDALLLLQDMPDGLLAMARAEYVRAKFAAADQDRKPEPEEPEDAA